MTTAQVSSENQSTHALKSEIEQLVAKMNALELEHSNVMGTLMQQKKVIRELKLTRELSFAVERSGDETYGKR